MSSTLDADRSPTSPLPFQRPNSFTTDSKPAYSALQSDNPNPCTLLALVVLVVLAVLVVGRRAVKTCGSLSIAVQAPRTKLLGIARRAAKMGGGEGREAEFLLGSQGSGAGMLCSVRLSGDSGN
jgi:hypothetical protein